MEKWVKKYRQSKRDLIKKIFENKLRGSMTVEAAMVFPIVLFTVFSLVYASLYLHDKVVIQSVMRQVVGTAEIAARYPVNSSLEQISYENINNRGIFFSIHSNYEVENRLYSNQLLKQLSGRLYITDITKCEIELTYSNVKASVRCFIKIPIQSVCLMLGKDKMHYNDEVSIDVFRVTEFVRVFDVFSDVVTDTKVGDQAISKLQDIIQGGR